MKIAVLLVALLAVGACSSSQSSSNSDAVSQCKALEYATCDRAAMCLPDAGSTTDCESSIDSTLNCSKATSVTGNYDTCLSDLANDPCDQLFVNYGDSGIMVTTADGGMVIGPMLVSPPDCVGVVAE